MARFPCGSVSERHKPCSMTPCHQLLRPNAGFASRLGTRRNGQAPQGSCDNDRGFEMEQSLSQPRNVGEKQEKAGCQKQETGEKRTN